MPIVWINAGEPSGDLQASTLLSALKKYNKTIEVYGMGGSALAAAGQKNVFCSDELSVLGLVEVFTAIPRALRLLKGIKIELTRLRPDVVILVDAPAFNFRVAKIAYSLGLKVCYFIPPKVWAWGTGRVNFLRKYLDTIISILPFEPLFYQQHNLQINYVGNPLVDLVNWPSIQHIQFIKGRIGLMPGSRRKEVETLLPEFGIAAQKLLSMYPWLTFFCFRSPNISERYLQSLWPTDVPLQIEIPEHKYAVMRSCEYILAASGTATLETALAGVPTIVTYKISPLSAIIAHLYLKVKWVSLPNLILGKEVFPEFLQTNAKGSCIADKLGAWINQPDVQERIQNDLDKIREKCGKVGSADRAAQIVIQNFLS